MCAAKTEKKAPATKAKKAGGKKVDPTKRCKANGNRVFVHPQEDVLQCEQGVFAPGQEVPVDKLDPQMVADWFHDGLLIEEPMYRMYHGNDWNSRHPLDRVKAGRGGVDICHVTPSTGDEITDDDGKAPIYGG